MADLPNEMEQLVESWCVLQGGGAHRRRGRVRDRTARREALLAEVERLDAAVADQSGPVAAAALREAHAELEARCDAVRAKCRRAAERLRDRPGEDAGRGAAWAEWVGASAAPPAAGVPPGDFVQSSGLLERALDLVVAHLEVEEQLEAERLDPSRGKKLEEAEAQATEASTAFVRRVGAASVDYGRAVVDLPDPAVASDVETLEEIVRMLAHAEETLGELAASAALDSLTLETLT